MSASFRASFLQRLGRGRTRARLLSATTVLAWLAFEFIAGRFAVPHFERISSVLALVAIAAFAGELGYDTYRVRLLVWRYRWPEFLLAVPAGLALAAGSARGAATMMVVRLMARELMDLLASRAMRPMLDVLLRRPVTLLCGSFLGTILLGTLALMAPAATRDGTGASLSVAFFTATSATCVTGLTVVDTASHFSHFGHWVILVLIQVGGLGIMTITTTLAMMFRGSLSGRASGAMQEILEEDTIAGFRNLVISMVLITVTVEALGAFALYPAFATGFDGQPLEVGQRIFHAVFHSVSAFCNAGMALYPDNLMRFVGSPGVNVTVMALIILGGLGFPVIISLLNARRWWRHGVRGAWSFIPVHARVVLQTSALLVVTGASAFLLLEWGGALSGQPLDAKVWASLFQSVTLRTAGFNTVDFAAIGTPMLLLCLVFMFIGGSPGGTAGGIKTTTAAVLYLTFRALLRGRSEVEVHGRSLPAQNVYRAAAVTVISLGLLFTLALLLLAAEPHLPFRDVLFEAVSAFGTVGLSTGITGQLSGTGRVLVCALMFVGRLGPFTLALAVGAAGARGTFNLPSTKIVVG